MPSTDLQLSIWDRAGLSLSGLCLVHCLAFPVALALLPLWPALHDMHGMLHLIFAALLVPLTIGAIGFGFRRHRSRSVVLLLMTGLALVVAVAYLGHEVLAPWSETSLTVAGSVLLMVGHWQNWRRGLAFSKA